MTNFRHKKGSSYWSHVHWQHNSNYYELTPINSVVGMKWNTVRGRTAVSHTRRKEQPNRFISTKEQHGPERFTGEFYRASRKEGVPVPPTRSSSGTRETPSNAEIYPVLLATQVPRRGRPEPSLSRTPMQNPQPNVSTWNNTMCESNHTPWPGVQAGSSRLGGMTVDKRWWQGGSPCRKSMTPA